MYTYMYVLKLQDTCDKDDMESEGEKLLNKDHNGYSFAAFCMYMETTYDCLPDVHVHVHTCSKQNSVLCT